ncbi:MULTISPECIES: DUF417 family protein [unclassified Aliivibrio]|uniref:DUF417 family protein n=1 Tax=unclassified Aliivibrio TaxID=2645654 RepID=UPI00080E9696|nr:MULTISPECIES: DUF417 family protein [unclassified Aliivibrio]OCH18840.1 hypothetical protein A6E05_00360 [Aliivibrio sp. 1S165]OCH19705.1 hypothetical protein A6E03_10275 [Aliivibrio sp. 1S128]OCH30966.1 hypothetical protein A6E06_05145 [Aliivibrio sp. 1S175]
MENKTPRRIHNETSLGYKIGVFGVILTLLWIGIFKFTPTEAAAIEPLVINHPLIGWIYHFISVQMVSNIIGLTEIVIAIGLIVGFFNPKVGYFSGILALLTFITTLSFLATTPNTWTMVDGVLTTNFFLLKDIVFISISLLVIEHNKKHI